MKVEYELPCKIGDSAYYIDNKFDDKYGITTWAHGEFEFENKKYLIVSKEVDNFIIDENLILHAGESHEEGKDIIGKFHINKKLEKIFFKFQDICKYIEIDLGCKVFNKSERGDWFPQKEG